MHTQIMTVNTQNILIYSLTHLQWYFRKLFQSTKLEHLFSQKCGKRDVRALIFEFWNSIRKCRRRWDRLYLPKSPTNTQKNPLNISFSDEITASRVIVNIHPETFLHIFKITPKISLNTLKITPKHPYIRLSPPYFLSKQPYIHLQHLCTRPK